MPLQRMQLTGAHYAIYQYLNRVSLIMRLFDIPQIYITTFLAINSATLSLMLTFTHYITIVRNMSLEAL